MRPRPADLPDYQRVVVESRLLLGERIEWCGRPQRMQADDRFYIQLALIIATFGVALLLVRVAAPIAPLDSAIFFLSKFAGRYGILLIVISLLISGPYWSNRKLRYVVTNRRIYILPGAGMPQMLFPEEFTCFDVVRERGDCGDLVLRREVVGSTDGPMTVEIGLFGVTPVREVEELVKDLFDASRPERPPLSAEQGKMPD